ncbi:PEP-CTERM system histidine kinase PrsK [Sphingobium sp. DEHP117]|uniref:XrtA/PEP-CTERM system histidine kinase PrsK n=1 Tax=Sphingobium sp. DEHP117 TaxID=2993436 RepID=UPI0027D66D21|nr:XrtA/PEP-CTERM system histidine kinase PrsK [Sphingobium sp. DEHP117]MDQ4419526.1 PEP-CTERM system histidine kinase PrsK [Sphingobium sp. DEHP117]
MSATLLFVGDWGHVLAAALFAVLSVLTGRRLATQQAGKLLVVALALTSTWLLSVAFGGVDRLETGVLESLRNCGWLVCLFVLPARLGGGVSRQARGARPLYLMLALLLVAQTGLDVLASIGAAEGVVFAGASESAVLLRLLWAIGALLLIQRIYIACSAHVRGVIGPIAAALAAMWGYDLILYGAAFAQAEGLMAQLFALRGINMAALAPVMALAGRTGRTAVVAPSRALALRGLGVVLGTVLSLLILGLLLALDTLGSPLVKAAASAVLFVSVAGGLLFVPATRLHRVAKVLASKHLFRHRYDYREQWMAFADTLGRGAQSHCEAAIHSRVIRAMADITQSSCGALLLAEEGDAACVWAADWNWKAPHGDRADFAEPLMQRMQSRGWITDLPVARAQGDALPGWLVEDQAGWALVPLVHFDQLVGVMLLGHPPLRRALDWEDFDMLRAAARQVASYLAEARGQAALAEARRFEEFNQRFAFILHDIKNLVSQIALTARNAERHADNPEFRADMILTLKDCAGRMNTLLARLGQHGSPDEPLHVEPLALGEVLKAIAARQGAAHPVLIEGNRNLLVNADRMKLEQVLAHLVQNAIEASDASSPVVLRVEKGDGGQAVLHVIDHGCGMTADFMRGELFRPFTSTKQGGFGIGAYEARELVRAMGGQLSVASEPGRGTCVSVHLPMAATHSPKSSAPARDERAA